MRNVLDTTQSRRSGGIRYGSGARADRNAPTGATARAAVDPRTAGYAAFLLRLGLGAVFVAHALFKLVVLTLPGTAAFFAAHGFPAWTAYPVFLAELLGGLALVAGFHARWVALALVPVMAGALLVHWPNGWAFTAPDGGWEYVAFLAVTLLVQAGLGDGAFALRGVDGRARSR